MLRATKADSPRRSKRQYLEGTRPELVNAAWQFWWARQDLNLGPTDYESAALTAELRAPFLHHPTPKELADIGEGWLKEFKSRRLLGRLCRSLRGTKCLNTIPGGHRRCSLTVAHAWWRPWWSGLPL